MTEHLKSEESKMQTAYKSQKSTSCKRKESIQRRSIDAPDLNSIVPHKLSLTINIKDLRKGQAERNKT